MLLENNPYPQDVRVRAEARSLVKAGYEVTVLAPRGPDQPRNERIDGVDVVRFRLMGGRVGGAAGFVLEYLTAGILLNVAAVRALLRGSAVLHIHNPPDIFFPAAAAFRLMGRRVIFDHHDLFPETLSVKFGWRPAVAAARLCQRITFALANRVISTNVSYADVAIRSGRKPRSYVTVVRNGPPAAWVDRPVVTRDGILENPHLAYVGAISSQDGVEGLAPVLTRLCSDPGPLDARLTIIGDGDGRALLEKKLEACGMAARVTFTGWLAAERVPDVLATADICVDPAPASDVNQRSTMTKISEYLALGKPVVAYDLLETHRTAGDAALLVRPGDVDAFAAAIAGLARDPARRRRLVYEGRRRAAELTWEQSEPSLLEVYRELEIAS
jgi:glycosyltransferase involved in cell wall biosynthesis